MNKKDAKILCDLMNSKNNGFRYSLMKSSECANCWDLKKDKIEAKTTKKDKKNAESEANNGVAE
ncbi:MAG: hypothetical protein IIW86_01565 [Clostridia bacterium]|nr:hypothetical protein [Clostridia bacterium]